MPVASRHACGTILDPMTPCHCPPGGRRRNSIIVTNPKPALPKGEKPARRTWLRAEGSAPERSRSCAARTWAHFDARCSAVLPACGASTGDETCLDVFHNNPPARMHVRPAACPGSNWRGLCTRASVQPHHPLIEATTEDRPTRLHTHLRCVNMVMEVWRFDPLADLKCSPWIDAGALLDCCTTSAPHGAKRCRRAACCVVASAAEKTRMQLLIRHTLSRTPGPSNRPTLLQLRCEGSHNGPPQCNCQLPAAWPDCPVLPRNTRPYQRRGALRCTATQGPHVRRLRCGGGDPHRLPPHRRIG
jgi:hypothetical protein